MRDEVLRFAAGRLHDPLGLLGSTRQGLMAREVPPGAFGGVAASRDVGTRHASTITDSLRALAAKVAALRGLAEDVTAVNQRFRSFDDAKARELGPDERLVDQLSGDGGQAAAWTGADQRDRVNRARIEAAIAEERARLERLEKTPDPQPHQSSGPNQEISRAEDRIESYRGVLGVRDAKILSFDPTGNGRVVALLGDIDAGTGSVGVLVPGMRTGLDDFAGNAAIAGSFVAPDGARGGTAMVLWQDGAFPQHFDAVSSDAARDMAPALRDFVNDDLRAMTGDEVPITVIGHSYGGAIVGLADAAGMQANNVVHLESAGMGHGVTPAELQAVNPDVVRYSVTSPSDPISLSQGREFLGLGHGMDPDTFPGNIQLESGRDAEGVVHQGIDAHHLENVIGMHADSWWDVNGIITGSGVPLSPAR